jgi:hypothetical protein
MDVISYYENWIQFAQDRVPLRTLVNTAMNLRDPYKGRISSLRSTG